MSLMTTKPISLDLYNNAYVCVNAKQLDTESRYIEVSCTENGKKIKLNPNEIKAFVRYKKPDGLYVLNESEVTSSGTVMVELTQQMLAVSGRSQVDILLIDASLIDFTIDESIDFSTLETSILSTMCFYIQIHSSAIEGADFESTYEFDTLLTNMAKMVAFEKELNKNENTRNENETQRQSNETQRVNNEDNRIIAEQNRESLINETITNCNDLINQTIEECNTSIENTKTQYQDFIDNKIEECNTAIVNTETVINNANTAIENVNVAKENADTATLNAQEASENADIATKNANDAADRANTAAELCEGIVAGSNLVLNTEKGVANGIATLNENAQIPTEQIPALEDGTSIFDAINDQQSILTGLSWKGEYTGNIDDLLYTDNAGGYKVNGSNASGTQPFTGYYVLKVDSTCNGVVQMATEYGSGITKSRCYINLQWYDWTTDYVKNNFTASKVLISDSSGKASVSSVSSNELSYLSGATSNIQEQFNNIGTIKKTEVSSQAITANSWDNVGSITLSAGTWLITATVNINTPGTDVTIRFSHNTNVRETIAYNNSLTVSGNMSVPSVLSAETTIHVQAYSASEKTGISTYIYAVRLK